MRVTGGAQEARTISMFAELETLKTNKNLETSDLRIIPMSWNQIKIAGA